MGKSFYLKRFQKNLRNCIEDLICNEWGYSEWLIKEEDGDMPGKFRGYMDISIYNPNKEKSVLAIEIEHKSGYYQAERNIRKLKEWAHNSAERAVGLLHIFNKKSNIEPDDINSLVKFAKYNEHKNHGLYYDFTFYSVDDARKTRQIAEDVVSSIDFQARLNLLIEKCGLI